MNEQLKFYKGKSESSLPNSLEPGAIYHCEDTGNTYLGGEENESKRFSSTVGKTILNDNNSPAGEIFNDYENNSATGNYSHAEGSDTKALGDYSHVEGYCEGLPSRIVPGTNSLAANSTVLYISVPKDRDLSSFANTYIEYENNFAFIISVENLGSPDAVLPEGGSPSTTEDTWRFTLSNPLSNTNIQNVSLHNYAPISIALGKAAHAEGVNTGAIGITSHAEGYETIALGDYSHAEGQATQANGYHQHVQGRFNIIDENNEYAHIVGNGNITALGSYRSNAHTLDWSGNAWFAGNLKIGGSGQDDETAQEIATKNYVLEQINIATDEEIIDLLIQLDMLPAFADSDGSVLSDKDDNILSW